MGQDLQTNELLRLLPLLLLLGSLASASGNSHTAVANQTRALIAEFHQWRFSEKKMTAELIAHLRSLQAQIQIFEARTRRCSYIHIANYSALCIAGLVILPTQIPVADRSLAALAEVLICFVGFLVSGMCLLRIQELLAGKDTMIIAVTEVLETKLEGIPRMNPN